MAASRTSSSSLRRPCTASSDASGLQAAPTQVGQSSSSSYADYHRAPPTQVGVQPAAPTYASVTQAGKVGWHSKAVVAARDDWPPLSAFVVPKRTQHRRPVVVPPVFQSEAERAKLQAQARAEVLRTAAPTTAPSPDEAMDVTEEMTPINPLTDPIFDPEPVFYGPHMLENPWANIGEGPAGVQPPIPSQDRLALPPLWPPPPAISLAAKVPPPPPSPLLTQVGADEPRWSDVPTYPNRWGSHLLPRHRQHASANHL